MRDDNTSLSASAVRFFSGTLISRIFGFGRDVITAYYFGTSPALAAFFIAFRFIYLLRRLFGAGILQQGFIPHFEEKRMEDAVEASRFFRDLFWTLALCLLCIVLVAFSSLSFFVLKGVGGDVLLYCMLIVPGIFFVCLFGLTSALLQAERRFFLSSFSPAFFNVVWIVGIFFLHNLPANHAMVGLCITVIIAFFFQWAATLPAIWHYLKEHMPIRSFFQPRLFSPTVKKLAAPLFLGMIGVASIQVNSAIDSVFARFADLEGPAYLWYAVRMQQLPLALFGIALSTALLPSLSRFAEAGKEEQFRSLLTFTLSRTLFLILPCVFGIYVLGLPSISLLFGRGDFGGQSITETAWCLWGYGIGLLPAALVQIYAPAFYARKDYKTPAKGFAGSALLNIVLNALFVFVLHLGAASIALATGFTALSNSVYLAYKLKQREGPIRPSYLGPLFSSLLAASVTIVFGRNILGDATTALWLGEAAHYLSDFSMQIAHFGMQAGLFFALYFGLHFALKLLLRRE